MATLKAKLQPVEVLWNDATSEGGWRSVKDHRATRLVPCRTLGFLTRWDTKVVQVIQTRSVSKKPQLGEKQNLGDVRGTDSMTIPREWAIRVRVLR